MFHLEGHIVGAHFEHGGRARSGGVPLPVLLPSKAIVEETRVVVAQLTNAHIHGQHLGRQVGWNAYALVAGEYIKVSRVQDAATLLGVHGVPECLGIVGALLGKAQQGGVGASTPASGVASLQADREQKVSLVAESDLVDPKRALPVKSEGGLPVDVLELLGRHPRVSPLQANLAEPIAPAQLHREGQGADLQVQGAPISRWSLIKAGVARAQDPREQVAASRGAARVESGGHVCWQG